jgi:hypothetical protein
MFTSKRFKNSSRLEMNPSTTTTNRRDKEFVPYSQERDHLGRLIINNNNNINNNYNNFSENFDLASLMKIETNDGDLN